MGLVMLVRVLQDYFPLPMECSPFFIPNLSMACSHIDSSQW